MRGGGDHKVEESGGTGAISASATHCSVLRDAYLTSLSPSVFSSIKWGQQKLSWKMIEGIMSQSSHSLRALVIIY